MSKVTKIKKGIDIKLIGVAKPEISDAPRADVFALKPDDFFGSIPRLMVREGDEVKAGTPLFCDKKRENITFNSPVSGEVVEVRRGAKRKILEVKILADRETSYEAIAPWTAGGDKESLIKSMLTLGVWAFIRQRPYGIIASPHDTPRSIFVSGFDSAPLAPVMEFILRDQKKEFMAGIEALNLLCNDQVFLGVPSGNDFFNDIKGVNIKVFSGPHPAGNVGVQIHHTQPINKGEIVWTVNPADVALIGRSLLAGKFMAERIIALAGSEVKAPQYYRTHLGTTIKSLVAGKVKEGNVRYISGNVLTGTHIDEDGFLGYYDTMVTVIPEGDHKQFFLTEGWLAPGFSKFSLNHSYPSWLMKNKRYRLDTNLNGERRAFVVTGEMEKVFPFDIYPMQLIKSIMINDIDAMEKLGIYEVLPEDFALCEFACTSKINIQSVVEQGLTDMRNEFAS